MKTGHPSPTSEGVRERQLASLQVVLRHKPPPTQPVTAASLQEPYKKAYGIKIPTSVLAWGLYAQIVGEQGRLPEAGGLGLMSKPPTHLT